MRLPYRLRHLLATRPIVYWTLALALAAVTATVVQRLTTDAAAAQAEWGDTRPTLVTVRAVAAGAVLGPDDATVRPVPVALRPDGALDGFPAAPAPALVAPLAAGEVVTAARLGRSGRSELAGVLPEGDRGVAVAVPAGLPVAPGDRVDVIGPDGTVTGSGPVLRVGEEAAVVAVPTADAAAVARAAADGTAVLVLAG